MNEHGQTLCLCMIVKNEARVIGRCLDSLAPLIDCWVIVDTGSTDGTPAVIARHLRKIPGRLYHRPWRDFAHNRSEALALARRRAEYSLIMDADDTVEMVPGFRMPRLTAGSYAVTIRDAGTEYTRPQIVSNAWPWRYEGVLHEYLTCDDAPLADHLPGIVIRRHHDGARQRDPATYQRDTEVLEAALRQETSPFLIARYRFYLAQSYRDCGAPAEALTQYLARAELGFWQEEVFVSLYQAAKLREVLGHPEDDVIATYLRAAEAAPHRAEAFHGASRFCRIKGRNEQGYQLARRGLAITRPGDALFLEPWIYEFGLLDELAVNAYWSGHHRESLDAAIRLLATPDCPAEHRDRFAANARAALERLPPDPNLGALGSEGFLAQHALGAPRALRSRLNPAPRILLAILAKQKEPSLPLYLHCIEALDYPKSAIVLYVRTNNNTDNTAALLRAWLDRVGPLYAAVEFDAEDVATPVQTFAVHEWNVERFRVLGRIRGISLRKTAAHGCDFYFVADVDNFIRPCTLRELVALNLPIVAPLLRSVVAERLYANYHAEIDANGYYVESDQYYWILNRWVRGVLEVPVVHCTYLIRADILDALSYEDETERFEYVIFSDSARRAMIPQYIDNRQLYGYITFDASSALNTENGIALAADLLRSDIG
jgi:hypothetical protein